MSASEFMLLPLAERISLLYREGTFVVAIRYYGYKVNLYLINGFYVEAFYNHKLDKIERIELLPNSHTRLKFYSDQISLPSDLLQ
ncbi:MAG: hypothetical protein WBA23_21290 [Tunicatimonas sp.]|uniref:hypothetical protein n=1 Tax=Tunicatimonas sp. TaxID=1940096 RepID=UPI003C7243C0